MWMGKHSKCTAICNNFKHIVPQTEKAIKKTTTLLFTFRAGASFYIRVEKHKLLIQAGNKIKVYPKVKEMKTPFPKASGQVLKAQFNTELPTLSRRCAGSKCRLCLWDLLCTTCRPPSQIFITIDLAGPGWRLLFSWLEALTSIKLWISIW